MSIPSRNEAEATAASLRARSAARWAIYYGARTSRNIFVAMGRGTINRAEALVDHLVKIGDGQREHYEIVDFYAPQPKPKRFSVEIEGVDQDDAERKLRDALRAGPTTLELREV